MSRKFVLSRFQRSLLGSLKAVPGEDGRLFKRLPINQPASSSKLATEKLSGLNCSDQSTRALNGTNLTIIPTSKAEARRRRVSKVNLAPPGVSIAEMRGWSIPVFSASCDCFHPLCSRRARIWNGSPIPIWDPTKASRYCLFLIFAIFRALVLTNTAFSLKDYTSMPPTCGFNRIWRAVDSLLVRAANE